MTRREPVVVWQQQPVDEPHNWLQVLIAETHTTPGSRLRFVANSVNVSVSRERVEALAVALADWLDRTNPRTGIGCPDCPHSLRAHGPGGCLVWDGGAACSCQHQAPVLDPADPPPTDLPAELAPCDRMGCRHALAVHLTFGCTAGHGAGRCLCPMYVGAAL